jgi:hypothetical protein
VALFRTLGLLGVVTIGASFTPVPACADSWALPTTTTYTSCAGGTRVIVIPRALDSQLAYFEDKVDEVAPAGQKTGGSVAATARLERRLGGRWQTVWTAGLANEVAPVDGIVRDDGSYFVTFDDWHRVGHGPNVVVIYGASGERIRVIALNDLVPSEYVEALPHSVSSIRWRGTPRFSGDGRQVLVPVIIPSDDDASDAKTIEFAIDLTDGSASPIDRDSWKLALAKGRRVHASRIAADKAAKAAFLAPLIGPTRNTQEEWHDYLREAVGRLIGDDDTPSTTVLRTPGAKDYAVSETWVREALTDGYADKVALATLSEPNLVAVLGRIGSSVRHGSLSKLTVFVAVSDRHWRGIVSALQGTGARLVQLDPNEALPQRPERAARRYGS